MSTLSTREHALRVAVLEAVAEAVLKAAGAGIPVVAFNAAFDLTMLDRECQRHEAGVFGWELDAAKPRVVDPYVLDKALDRYRKGSRKLTDTAAHYGVTAGKAHDAAGDTITAARLAWMIAKKYPNIGRMGVSQLMTFQKAAKADQARSYVKHLISNGEEAKAATVSAAWPWKPQTAGATA